MSGDITHYLHDMRTLIHLSDQDRRDLQTAIDTIKELRDTVDRQRHELRTLRYAAAGPGGRR